MQTCGAAVRLTGHHFEQVEETHNGIDYLFDNLEEIAELRHQLTGSGYGGGIAGEIRAPASHKAGKKLAGQIAARVPHAAADLLALYQKVVAISPQVEAAAAAANAENSASGGARDARKALSRLNSSFANLLDFVEECAADEKREITDGKSDTRLRGRVEEDHPKWYRTKVAEQVATAKADSRWQTFAKVQVRHRGAGTRGTFSSVRSQS